MPFTDDVKELIRKAEKSHEKGKHQEAIEGIKGVIDKLPGLEQANVYCLWGYCLEDLECYFTARKAYIAALMSLRKKPVKIKDLTDGEEQERTRGEEEQWKKEQEAWREQDKANATYYFEELKSLNTRENREKLVMAAKVFSALGDLSFKERRFEEGKEQYKRAKKLCARAIDGDGPDGIKAEAHYRMGYVLMQLEDYKGSKDNYEKAINLYRSSEQTGEVRKRLAKAYNGLGNLYLHQNRIRDAREEYRNAIGIIEGPIPPIIYNFTPPLNNLAYTLYLLGDYEEAEKWCIKARDSGEESAEFYDTRGCVYSGLKRYKEAKEVFEKALDKKKKNPNIRNNYGDFLRIIGFYEEAKNQLDEAIKQNKFLAAAHSNLGDLYREQKNYNEAEPCYIEARKLDPRLPDARFGLADCYVTQAETETDKKPGLYSTALKEMNLIPELTRGWPERHPRFYLLRGYIYWKLGKYSQAKRDFRTCMMWAIDEEIFSKARENLKALEVVEPKKLMTWGGVVLAGIATAVLIAITVFYLSFPSIETPSPPEKGQGAGVEAAK